MCGRYTQQMTWRELVALYRIAEPELAPVQLRPRYNVAPTQDMPIVRRTAEGRRELAIARWGLIPPWAPEPKMKFSTINARAEGLAEKPIYRGPFKARRCLVPADGFYEWKAEGKLKQPYRIVMKGEKPFAFAGLWERRRPKDGGEGLDSYTIVTTAANTLMATLHDRMPVILDPADYDRWLDPAAPEPGALLRPCPDDWLEMYPVSTVVNAPRNDTAACIARLG